MKKIYSLILTFALLSMTWAGKAQKNLTIHDGTVTNHYVPAYVFFFDDFSRSQFVIPAGELVDMVGELIQEMTFYTTAGNIPYTSTSIADVYLKEVDYTSISDFESTGDASFVYNGTLDFVSDGSGGGTLTITFNTPYFYTGNNLLVGIENITDEGYANIYFYGETVNGASIAGSDASSPDNVDPTQRNFLPKTTFTYDLCPVEDKCEISYFLSDSYGDGWNGCAINVVDVETGNILDIWTIESGDNKDGFLNV